MATSIDRTGTSILFSEFAAGAASDMWILPLQANGKPGATRPFLNTPAFETHGTFSPDGKLVAYMSSEQGAFEIYVRTFDGAGGPWRASTAGGAHPTWSKNTQELIYVTDDQLMAVKYRLKGDTFESERARAWAPVRYATAGPTRKYALHPDGKRVIVATPDTTRGGQVRHGDVCLQFLRRAAAAAAAGSVRPTSPQQFACRDRSAHWQQRGR